MRELDCSSCKKNNLPIGIIIFTRGEYRVYCKKCLEEMFHKPKSPFEVRRNGLKLPNRVNKITRGLNETNH